MRRADRLFDIIQQLRGGRLRTAQELAEQLEVSVRTIYRDIDALVGSGVPIEGERGVGYVLRDGLLMPPLAFTAAELQALALGARMVRAWADPELGSAASEALAKIDAGIESDSRPELWRPEVQAFGTHMDRADRERLALLRKALRQRRKLRLGYARAGEPIIGRTVRPLGLEAWGHCWTLTSWCELRQDFRVFRLDRIASAEVLDERFRTEAGKTLSDFVDALKRTGFPVAT
jgi:predicted DNA-binding transcriptional regulator YafY